MEETLALSKPDEDQILTMLSSKRIVRQIATYSPKGDSSSKNRQGRPPAKDGVNGRQNLIEKTRELLKAKPRVDIQRQEIAKYAGITPALVSYYFPDKWDLIEASAASLIDKYLCSVLNVTSKKKPGIAEFKALLRIYVEFSFEGGYILDFYLQNITSWKNLQRQAQLRDAHRTILTFFSSLMTSGHLTERDPSIVNSVLWASSHYLAQQAQNRHPADASESTHNLQSIVEELSNMFLHGIAP